MRSRPDAIRQPIDTLLRHITALATPRQLRLFAVACCRLVWDRLSDPASRAAVEVAEQFADGLASEADLDAVRRPAYLVRDETGLAKLAADVAKRHARDAALMVSSLIASAAPDIALADGLLPVLLDVFENTPCQGMQRPGQYFTVTDRQSDFAGQDFRGTTFADHWRTGTVRAIAEAMYASRDFTGMPILADALEESGCADADILEHCRSSRPHFRGCWVVDGLRGESPH